MKRRYFFRVFLAGLGIFLGACSARQKAVTNLPPGVTQQQAQNWDAAVANLDKIAQSVSTFRQLMFQLNQQTYADPTTGKVLKIIPDSKTYAGILMSIGKIDQAEIDAAMFLKAQPQNFGVTAQARVKNDIVTIEAELSAISTQQLAGIKSTSSLSQVQALVTEIGRLAALVLSLT